MAITTDTVALNDWEAIGNIDEIASGKRRNTRLLGQDIIAEMDGDRPRVFEANANGGMGREHPAQVLYGHVWTTLGTPVKPPLDMPEFLEDGRRLISCGAVTVRASPLRIVENFLDMSHFHSGGRAHHRGFRLQIRNPPARRRTVGDGMQFFPAPGRGIGG